MCGQVFISSAGVIGPHHQVDHDISLLIPELWGRMHKDHQNAQYLTEYGYLEKVEDMTIDGKLVQASLLGYRITAKFVNRFFGRIFEIPDVSTRSPPRLHQLAAFFLVARKGLILPI